MLLPPEIMMVVAPSCLHLRVGHTHLPPYPFTGFCSTHSGPNATLLAERRVSMATTLTCVTLFLLNSHCSFHYLINYLIYFTRSIPTKVYNQLYEKYIFENGLQSRADAQLDGSEVSHVHGSR